MRGTTWNTRSTDLASSPYWQYNAIFQTETQFKRILGRNNSFLDPLSLPKIQKESSFRLLEDGRSSRIDGLDRILGNGTKVGQMVAVGRSHGRPPHSPGNTPCCLSPPGFVDSPLLRRQSVP